MERQLKIFDPVYTYIGNQKFEGQIIDMRQSAWFSGKEHGSLKSYQDMILIELPEGNRVAAPRDEVSFKNDAFCPGALVQRTGFEVFRVVSTADKTCKLEPYINYYGSIVPPGQKVVRAYINDLSFLPRLQPQDRVGLRINGINLEGVGFVERDKFDLGQVQYLGFDGRVFTSFVWGVDKKVYSLSGKPEIFKRLWY